MNEIEQQIMEIIKAKPDGISSSEIESYFPEKDRGMILHRLKSLWKFKFIDRTKTKIRCTKNKHNTEQYYWRIHRVDKKIWTADMLVLVENETDVEYRKRMAKLLEQYEQAEVWA